MTIDQNILNKIRNYGALKYPSDRMCVLLGLDGENMDWFLEQMDDPKSEVRKYYDQGVGIGDYNQDVELAKKVEQGDVFAIIERNKIHEERRVADVRKDLFGV